MPRLQKAASKEQLKNRPEKSGALVLNLNEEPVGDTFLVLSLCRIVICYFFNVLADIDGLGSSAIGGQLMASASAQSPLSQNQKTDDSVVAGIKTVL